MKDLHNLVQFIFYYTVVSLLPYLSFCGFNKSSISFIHPSGNNDSFVSASHFKQISILIKNFASTEKFLLRSTFHSDDVRANSLQWVEGFEWSFVFDLFVSSELEQVRREQ